MGYAVQSTGDGEMVSSAIDAVRIYIHILRGNCCSLNEHASCTHGDARTDMYQVKNMKASWVLGVRLLLSLQF